MNTPEKRYLGDAVYAVIEYGVVVLTTEDGISSTNRIVLEPEVWFALKRFVEPEDERCPVCGSDSPGHISQDDDGPCREVPHL